MDYQNFREQVIYRPIERRLNFQSVLYQSWKLPFNMEPQPQSNWCWAATSKSISHFYARLLNPWTQCKIASEELGKTCCTDPVPGPCNVPWYLDRALTRTNNFVQLKYGTMSWEDVKKEIDKGLVVGVRVGWSGGGGHFMAIYGVSKILNTKYLHIDDPIYGKSTLTVSQFSTNYQGSGTWTHSYITKKHSYLMFIRDLVFQPELLKPIPEFRPLLNLQLDRIDTGKLITDAELSFPHHTYVLQLKDVDKEIRLPRQPSSLRVVEIEGNTPLALYDLSTNAERPEVLQVSTDPAYLDRLESGIERIKASVANIKGEASIDVLKFPALNMEALWLRTAEKNGDKYFLLRSFEKESELVDAKTFMELISRRKAEVEKQDELMGA
jgi:hypothetical protein